MERKAPMEEPMNAVKNLIAGLNEAIAYTEGHCDLDVTDIAVPEINVKEVRNSLDLSQEKFAEKYGLSVATVRNWEQGIRKPDGPARILLLAIANHPEMIQEVVDRWRKQMRPNL